MSPAEEIVYIHENQLDAYQCVATIKAEMRQVIVGQEALIEKLIIALICKTHVLIEGMPGLAKTLTVNALANVIGLNFGRVQFTPDLLPSDIIGTQIFNPKTFEFHTEKGPIFTNLLLADEINRAPAKVQSALLEAMQEKQITIGKTQYLLPSPFIVLATQNPIEQEGTYSLPEAQMDRFMFKITLDYPSAEEEMEVMMRMAQPTVSHQLQQVVDYQHIEHLSEQLKTIHIAPSLQKYIVDIVHATRTPSLCLPAYEELIESGASPRATIALALSAKAHALIHGRHYVIPSDIRTMACDVLRHRIKLHYQAIAQGMTPETIIHTLLNHIEIAND